MDLLGNLADASPSSRYVKYLRLELAHIVSQEFPPFSGHVSFLYRGTAGLLLVKGARSSQTYDGLGSQGLSCKNPLLLLLTVHATPHHTHPEIWVPVAKILVEKACKHASRHRHTTALVLFAASSKFLRFCISDKSGQGTSWPGGCSVRRYIHWFTWRRLPSSHLVNRSICRVDGGRPGQCKERLYYKGYIHTQLHPEVVHAWMYWCIHKYGKGRLGSPRMAPHAHQHTNTQNLKPREWP